MSEFLHITQNTSPQELQCMLDGIRECEKKLYVRDLTEELNEIGKLLKKLKESEYNLNTACTCHCPPVKVLNFSFIDRSPVESYQRH